MKDLIKKVNKAFGLNKKPAGSTFAWSIGPINNRWQFDVTDNWYKWQDLGLCFIFTGDSPEETLQNFLDYIKKQNIDPYLLRW